MAARLGSLLVAVAATGVALAFATAAQANYVAVANDPAGDATGAQPAHDLTAIGLSYDRDSGELVGGIRLAGEPSGDARAFVSLFAGKRTATGCNGIPAAGFGSYTDEFGASWLRIDSTTGDGPSGEAEKRGFLAQVQEFEIADARLQGHALDCAIATVSEPGNSANIYDTAGPVPLVGQPALSLRVPNRSLTLRAGRPRKIKLTLANDGDAATQRVRLKADRARGMRVKFRKRSLKPIAAGRRTTVTATITLSKRARSTTELRITATAGKLVARQERRLYVRHPIKRRGGRRDEDFKPQVCNRWVPDLSGETGGSLILVPC